MTTRQKYPIIVVVVQLPEAEVQLRKEIAIEADQRHQKMWDTVIPYSKLGELPELVKDQMANLSQESRKPKIAALYYGGTLGMHWEEKDGQRALVPTDDAKELLEPLEKWGLYDRMQIVWFPVLDHSIDSTNARWPHWVTMGNAVKLLYDNFDGFVIAGGTDSLRFMTSAMHFMFPNFGKPNIAVAAQKEASGWGSDAPENLAFALDTACSDISGTHLAMARKIRHGLHVFKIKDREYEAFDSPQQYILGHFDGKVNLYPNRPRRNVLVAGRNLRYNPNFRDGVFSTEIQPFANAGSLLHMSTDPFTQAILFITYGAGNARNEALYEGELTHIDVIKQLHEMRFPLVLGSPMQDGRVESPYKTGTDVIKAGAISGGDTTGAALLVKMARVLHDSWWDEEKYERIKNNIIVRQTRGIPNIARDQYYGVNYYEFRDGMYKDHVGELGIDIHDNNPY